MNPLELFHILQAILRNEAKVIAAFLVGVVLTIVAAYIDLVKDLQQRKAHHESSRAAAVS